MPLNFAPVEPNPKLAELGIHFSGYRGDYEAVSKMLLSFAKEGSSEFYPTLAVLAEEDFFIFCYFVLDLPVNDPFVIARVYDVQDNSHDTIDLWAREHWKSTLLTFARPLWDVVHNPEERQVVFSHTRGIAKAHLRRWKHAMEMNESLMLCWPEIFHANPESMAPKWSEDDGLIVIREGTFVEATFEAWGLVDGMPTSKHFTKRIYDDIITEKSVSTAYQVKKAYEMYQLSDALGVTNGGAKRIIGTRYSQKDPYGMIMQSEKNLKVREFPAEVDAEGKFQVGGTPVFFTKAQLKKKFNIMGEYMYSAQMGQCPRARSDIRFNTSMLRFWRDQLPDLNRYMVVDPASTKDATSDYTCAMVFGVDGRRNYFILDIVRDRLNLGERWEMVRGLVQKYGLTRIGYEQTSRHTELEYFRERMEYEGVVFELAPLSSQQTKYSRIMSLLPLFQRGRIWLPVALAYVDDQKNTRDLVSEFINEEFLEFPYSAHDDMLDAMAYMLDPRVGVIFPTLEAEIDFEKMRKENPFDPLKKYNQTGGTTWMSQ